MENLGVILTKAHIIRMARDAGADRNTDFSDWSFDDAQLERFAALIAAVEREACAELCEQMDHDGVMIAADCAEAIRARGNQ